MQRRNKKSSSDRRHRKKYRGRRNMVTLFIIAAVCLTLGIAAVQKLRQQEAMKITANNAHDMGNSYREIEYRGKKYRYNFLVTSVLFAGLDTEEELRESRQYGNKPRTDSVYLAIFDKQNKKLSMLALSRDTMTNIRRYSLNGNDNGMSVSHLGYAYSYGDGGNVSCRNLCEAVSEMLGGIPVLDYVIAGQKAVPFLNGLMGNISLTVPNEDLQDIYPELVKGKEVTLTEENVITFLRYRDTEKPFSNEGRMERQKAYIRAYIKTVKDTSVDKAEKIWTSLEEERNHYFQTSITRNKYLNMIDLLQMTELTDDSFYTLEGEHREGELHDEFYPDKEALQELILKLFYEEV